jgi:hypothetical protein
MARTFVAACGRLAALLLLAGGCSDVLEPDVLDIQQLPDLPATKAPLQLKAVLKETMILQGQAGEPWAATSVADGLAVNLQQLAAPFANQLLPVDHVDYPGAPARSLCTSLRRPETGDYLVALRRPGDDGSAQVALPAKPSVMCGQRTLATYPTGLDPLQIDVLRRLPSGQIQHLRLPWPRGANPDWDQGPRAFDDDEQVLFVTDGDYRTQLHYLDSGELVDLGPIYLGGTAAGYFIYLDYDGFLHAYAIAERRDLALGFRLSPDGQLLGMDLDHLAILTCDWDGVRQVAIRPARADEPVVASQSTLDPTPCHIEYSSLAPYSGTLEYTINGQLRAVALDGKSPPRPLTTPSAAQIFAVCQDQAVAYSLDSPDRYGKGIGDGWIGGFRFMERGREARFSPDCRRLYFKEHAADLRRLGELHALLRAPGQAWDAATALRVARNVGFYQDLPDGRLLIADDLAVIGSQNRVSLIDLDNRTAKALLAGPGQVTGALTLGTYFPGRREVLLEVDTPELDNDRYLLYLPLPPKAPPPDTTLPDP